MRYVYTGPGPQEDPEGGIAHPGDVREFDAAPGWGAWTPADDAAGAPESAAEPPAVPSPAPAAPEPPAVPFTPVPEGS